jgi:hypothetical protein
MDKFLKELMDLITVEANNGDYYVDGYVPGYLLDELINKHFENELGYKFTSAYTYSRWYPRSTSKHNTTMSMIRDTYQEPILRQLTDTSGFDFFKKEVEPLNTNVIKFPLISEKSFKKDE